MIAWSEEKNEILKRERGLSFEEAEAEIESGKVLAIVSHPTRENQMMYVIRLDDYVCNVPYVLDEEGNIFLKTIYKTRKGQSRFGGQS